MGTRRFNICSHLHNELRTQLMLAGIKLQSTDLSCAEAAGETLRDLNKIIKDFEDHLAEDAILYDAIVSAAPYIVTLLDKANEKNRQLSIRISEIIKHYEMSYSQAERINLLADLNVLFFEFIVSVLNNMSKEETVINELLWLSHSDENLMQLENRLCDQNMLKAQGIENTETEASSAF